jgi:hypothetical protein
MNNEGKIILENSSDLYKLPISAINNTKIYNYKGKYFDKIYEEALKIERSGKNVDDFFSPVIKVEKLEFEILFVTEFGQRLVICGSPSDLGAWDITKA